MYFSPERNRWFAERLFAHVRNGTTDQAPDLMPYDLSMYADPAIEVAERTRIFERLPMMALHSSQLATPGDFATVQLNRTNAIVARQKDGSVKAFVNACRHRGATLTTLEQGHRNLLSCPYHGWSYTLDGALKAITFNDTYGPPPSPDQNLLELPVVERHGFIWIIENPTGTIDLPRHLGPGMDRLLAEYHFEHYHVYRSHVFEFPQNWKIMLEGVLDGYHVSFVHGATIKPYFHLNIMVIDDFGHHHVTGTPRRTIDALLDEVPGSSPLEEYAVFGNLVSPNCSFVLHPHHVEHWTVYQHPNGPGHCRVMLRLLTPRKVDDERGHAIMEKNWQIASRAIVNEDVPVGNGIQQSASFPHTGATQLGRNEVGNQVFHRAWRHYMGL